MNLRKTVTVLLKTLLWSAAASPNTVMHYTRVIGILLAGTTLFYSCGPNQPNESVPMENIPEIPGLYLEDMTVPVPGVNTLVEALDWLANNAKSNSRYAMYLGKDETVPPSVLRPDTMNGAANVEFTLGGVGGERTVTIGGNGSLFTVETSGTKLILEHGITLHGKTGNNASLLFAHSGGALEMRKGSKVINNHNENIGIDLNPNVSGGIYVYRGSFTMTGGEISGNVGTLGGGVGLNLTENFIMSGGVIQKNRAQKEAGGLGIMDVLGSGTISGGSIMDNTAYNGSIGGTGGGLAIAIDGTITISGGNISGNRALGTDDEGGGGIHVISGIVLFTGGTIENNRTETAQTGSKGSDNLKLETYSNVATNFVNSTGTPIAGSVPAL